MRWRMFMQSETVVVKFDGNISGIDVNAFAHVMLDYATVAQAAAKTIDPLARVDVSITAAEQGCLQALLQIAPTALKQAIDFTVANLPIAQEIIDTASSLYSFKKEIGRHGAVDGSKELAGGKVEVKMRDGNTTVIDNRTYNLFLNKEASESVNSTCKTLSDLDSVTGFEIKSESSPSSNVRVDRSEFAGIADSPLEPQPDLREGLYENQTLKIKRAFLDEPESHKWAFGWRETSISAKITDSQFFKRFPDLEFRMGDSLICDLKVYQELNASVGVYENKSYEVVKVHGKKNAPETVQMDI